VRNIGILSKLKDAFSSKSIDSLKEIETELSKLQKKINSEMIALIGIGGRIKGLPLVYIANDEDQLKKISARLYEILNPLNNLSSEHQFRDFIVNYDDSIIFFKPVFSNVGFVANIKDKDDIVGLKQWIYKYEQILKELFHEGS